MASKSDELMNAELCMKPYSEIAWYISSPMAVLTELSSTYLSASTNIIIDVVLGNGAW